MTVQGSNLKHDRPIKTVVTARKGVPKHKTAAVVGTRMIEFDSMSVVTQVLVRALRTYLQGLLAFLMIGLAGKPVFESVGVMIVPQDFWQALLAAAGLALAPAVISLLQNLIELLGKADEKYPKARA